MAKYEFNANTMTDDDAIDVVANIMAEKYGNIPFHRIFVVWKCKTIQNVKFIVGTTYDNIIYELTLNGDTNELYVDHYKKIDKTVINLRSEV